MKKYLHILILSAVISVLIIAPCIAQIPISDPWQKPVSLDLKDVSVKTAIETLLKGERINFAIDSNVPPEYVIPAFSIKEVPLRLALSILCKTAGLEYREDHGITIISSSPAQWAKWSRQVSVNYRDTPLRQALDDLFRKADAGSWNIDPVIQDIKVNYAASDVEFIKVLRDVLKPTGATFTWGSIFPCDPAKKIINLEAKNMPLVDVLRIIFDNTKLSYTLDQGLEALSVTATLKNTPFEVALRSVTSTAGLVYRIRDGVYLISSKPQVEVPSIQLKDQYTPKADYAMQQNRFSEVIDLKYLNAGDITRFVTGRSSVPLSVTATSGNKLILYGSLEDLDAAKKFVSALDVESALPRPVRLKLKAEININTPKGPKVYSTSTENVGAEKASILLNLRLQKAYTQTISVVTEKKVSKSPVTNFTNTNLLGVVVTPSINQDGTVVLSGKGSFTFPFGSTPGNEVSKDFDIAASVSPGKPYVVATGSMNLESENMNFTVTITATVEKGRVYVTPQQEQSSSQNSTPNFGIDPNNPSRTW